MKKELNNKKEELSIKRIFDAPIEKVWRAWTVADNFKKWWGPKDFTAPDIKIDLAVDGKYLFCMRGPDGKEYWSTGIYKKIIPHKKLVMTDSFADEKGNVVSASHYGMDDFPLELEVTVNFKERKNGKTEMFLRHRGLPRGQMLDLTRQGWEQSFDKLEKSLE